MKVIVTAALPYINNVPHLGHMSGSHLPADLFARYARQRGDDVNFIGGSDEHGTPSVIAAKQAGMPIQDFVDKLHEVHKRIYEKMMISYDNYSRTSSNEHKEMTQKFFSDLDANGYIFEREDEQYYSEADQMFLPDRFLIGECPSCSSEANSDQCEKCGKLLSAKELINPRSILSGKKPELRKTKHLFLDLEKLAPKLDIWIEENRDSWKKHVYAEAKKWVNDLKARAITRDMSWGVKVNKIGYEDKVFYVWFDAPIGYISFSKDWNESKIYHFLGKDNIPFHTIFWPAMLIGNRKYKLPNNVVGYNYLTFEGDKFSKSKGHGIFCYNLLNSNVDIDTIRFYLLYTLPESKDADFKWEEYMQVVNSQLIGNVSNFFNRTISMVNRYLDGKISLKNRPEDLIYAKHYAELVSEHFDKFELRAGIKKILEFSSLGNSFIEKQEPWKITDREKLQEVLYHCLDHARSLAILMSPIVPKSMSAAWEQLALPDQPNMPGLWHLKESFPLEHKINKGVLLYTKIDEAMLEKISSELTKEYVI